MVTPAFFLSMDTTVDNVKIKFLRLRHDGSTGNDQNVGYIIDFNGMTVFHAGDNDGYLAPSQAASGIMEYARLGMDSMKVDIAILNIGFFWETTSPGIQIVKRYIKPKHIILAHFSLNNWQGEWIGVQNTIRLNQAELPDVSSPLVSLESKTYYSTIGPTGVRDNNLLPADINLYQNYPNPFNPSTTIRYTINKSAHVGLTVFNLLGQKIKTLVDAYQSVGEHSIGWDATDDMCQPVGSGVYVYNLETDDVKLHKNGFCSIDTKKQ